MDEINAIEFYKDWIMVECLSSAAPLETFYQILEAMKELEEDVSWADEIFYYEKD